MYVKLKKGLLVWGDVRTANVLFFLFILFPVCCALFPPETYFRPAPPPGAPLVVAGESPVISKLTFMAMILFLAWIYFKHPKTAFNYIMRAAPIFILGVYILLTSFWAPNFMDGFNKAYRSLAVVALACALYFTHKDNQPDALISQALNTAMVLSLIMVICMPQYGLSGLRSYVGAWKGAFIQKNALGEMASYTLLFAVYQTVIARTRKARWLQCGFVLLALLMLAMSQSGTSLLSSVVALVVFMTLFLISQFSRQKVRIVIYAVMGLLGFGYAATGFNTDFVFQLTGRSNDFTGRRQIWDGVKEAIADKPLFGHGSGFWITESVDRNYLWSRIGDSPPHSHNTYLDMCLQYGFIGVGLFVLVGLAICIMAIRELVKNKSYAPIFYFSFFALLLVRNISEVTVGASDTSIFWYTIPVFGLVKLQMQVSVPARSAVAGPAPADSRGFRLKKRRIKRVSHYYK